MLNQWSQYQIPPFMLSTHLVPTQPLKRIACTDNRAFDMICSGAVQKSFKMREIVEIEIEMETDLNKVSVRLLYHLTRSGCSDFSAAQKGRHRFRSIRPTSSSQRPTNHAPTLLPQSSMADRSDTLKNQVPPTVAQNSQKYIEM